MNYGVLRSKFSSAALRLGFLEAFFAICEMGFELISLRP